MPMITRNPAPAQEFLSHEPTAQFLRWLYGDEAQGWLTLWLLPSKHTQWFLAHNLDKAAAYAVKQAQACDVYLGVGLRGTRLARGRGEADDVITLPALYVDIDLAHPVHKAANLPDTEEEARQLLTAIGVPPSLLLHSGHGLQAYWLLRELWQLASADERQQAAQMNERLQATIRHAALFDGWHVDGTADLARVLRLPGTFNRKDPTDVKAVRLIEADPTRRYNPSDFEPFLIDVDTGTPRPVAAQEPSTPLPDELPRVDIHQLQISAAIKFLILSGTHPHEPQRYTSRSEGVFAAMRALVSAGCDDATIASVLLDPAYRISEKPREKGRRWLRQELARAKRKAKTEARQVDSSQASPGADTGVGQRHQESNHQESNEADNSDAPPPPESDPPIDAEIPNSKAIHLTDWGNAQRLIQQYGEDLRYVKHWRKWLIWRGSYWDLDNVHVEQLAKRVIAQFFAKAAKAVQRLQPTAEEPEGQALQARKAQLAKVMQQLKWALTSESTLRIKAMVESARSEPGVGITPDQLDVSPWLLNAQNGTIDLTAGAIRPHQRADLITMKAPTIYSADAQCPQWLRFLQVIMANNEALISYLQRAVGYSLTGNIGEQCLFFLYGAGQNGKSTFLATIQAMLGPYAMQALPEMLMVRQHEQHPTERADLFKKRFVSTVEVESGKALAESLVKQLTGGERVRARRMREDFWEFDPTHKIWLAANHKPLIRGTDHAIWRRIRLIPFTVRIPDDKVDKGLAQKLQTELPGILRWAVTGCLDWQQQGLNEPPEVRAATESYRAEMDLIGQFLQDCCLLKPGREDIKTQSSRLYKAFCKWGSESMTQTAFSTRLTEMGYTKKIGGDGAMYWLGIGLVVTADSDADR
jgi:P4 family phage/plasmid primase-like protien